MVKVWFGLAVVMGLGSAVLAQDAAIPSLSIPLSDEPRPVASAFPVPAVTPSSAPRANVAPSLAPSETPMRLRKKAVVTVRQVYEPVPSEELAQRKQWRALATKIKATEDGPEREALGKDLRSLLETMFDAELDRRDNELAELEARVKKLREAIERRRTNRDRILTVQVDSVLLDADGWSLFQRPLPGPSPVATPIFSSSSTVVAPDAKPRLDDSPYGP